MFILRNSASYSRAPETNIFPENNNNAKSQNPFPPLVQHLQRFRGSRVLQSELLGWKLWDSTHRSFMVRGRECCVWGQHASAFFAHSLSTLRACCVTEVGIKYMAWWMRFQELDVDVARFNINQESIVNKCIKKGFDPYSIIDIFSIIPLH